MQTTALQPTLLRPPQQINLFGRQVASRRAELGYTQKEFTHHLQGDAVLVSDWERGNGLPTIETLPQIARTCKLPLQCVVEWHLADFLVNSPYSQVLTQENFRLAAGTVFQGIGEVLCSNALGDYLKALRENHGKTQSQVALQAKIDWRTLSQIETGRNFPEPANLATLALYYDKPLPELAGLCLATKAVADYAIFSEINLQAAWETALSLIPPSLSCGLKSIETLLEGKPQFLLAKISNLLQEQGISLKDHLKIKQIARAAKIPFQPFLEFVQGKRSLGDFLYSSSGDGEVIQNLAQALKYHALHLVGYLGIDLAYAEEVRQGRNPSYVSNEKKGVDLESVDLDERKRRIEVKAMSTIQPTLIFTAKEWEAANRTDERYYLLVIFNAATKEPTFFSLEGPLDYLEAKESSSGFYIPIKDIFSVARGQGHCLEPFPVGKIEISRPLSENHEHE